MTELSAKHAPLAAEAFEHTAVFVESDQQIVDRLAPDIGTALADGDAVLVSLDRCRWYPLAAAIGAPAADVVYVDAADRYPRPSEAMRWLHQLVGDALAAGARRVHSIGEIPFGSIPPAEWFRYEAAVNDVFVDLPLRAVCLYDDRTLAPNVIDAARATHAHVVDDDGSRASAHYAPVDLCRRLPARSLAPGRAADRELHGVTDGRRARRELLGGPGDAPSAIALVVSELVANAIAHGGAPVSVALWLEPGTIVVQVRDGGDGIADPFAGLRPPSFPHRGAGLWLTNQLADAMAITGGSGHGTEVTVVLSR